MTYSTLFNNAETPAHIKSHSQEVENHGGGFSFEISDESWFDRFLILGTASGTYYQNPKEISTEACTRIKEMITQGKGDRMLSKIYNISTTGRAPSNDPAIVALALIACYADRATKTKAFEMMPEIARTGTMFFLFNSVVRNHLGTGKQYRKGVSRWFLEKQADHLKYQVVKYRRRYGWTYKDVLRLSHTKPVSEDVGNIFKYLVTGEYRGSDDTISVLVHLTDNPGIPIKSVVEMIQRYKLPWEVIPNHYLDKPQIWESILHTSMPPHAILRNLGKMSSVGLLTERSDSEKDVLSVLSNIDRLKSNKVHPFSVLVAYSVYSHGRGVKGDLSWNPNPRISYKLEETFYNLFSCIPKTNKRVLVGNDVSPSMWGQKFCGSYLSSAEIMIAMNLLWHQGGSDVVSMAFSSDFIPLNIHQKTSLKEGFNLIKRRDFRYTDCSLPMLYALKHNIPTDVFIVVTDNETNYGKMHPHEALTLYRRKTGIPAKLVVIATTATSLSIAPRDAGCLDVVGFDTNVPLLIEDFLLH